MKLKTLFIFPIVSYHTRSSDSNANKIPSIIHPKTKRASDKPTILFFVESYNAPTIDDTSKWLTLGIMDAHSHLDAPFR